MVEKCLSGFTKFAAVAAHYRMSDVVDHFVVSMAKFSGLQNVTEHRQTFVPHFGEHLRLDLMEFFPPPPPAIFPIGLSCSPPC
jgi:hypothetical protein